MNRSFTLAATLATFVAAVGSAPIVRGQVRWIDPQFQVSNQWGNFANWDTFVTPDPLFHTEALIGSETIGAALSADVVVTGTFTAPTVRVGNASGSASSLTIAAGNSLSTMADLAPTGDFQIGGTGGRGNVFVSGALNVEDQLFSPTDADFQSTLQLTGSASVSAGYAFLDRQFRVVGPNVTFSTTGSAPGGGSSLILGGGGVHTFEFGAAGPSKLLVQGNLDLGGTLQIETPGYTPTPGTSWVIADSVAVDATDASPTGFSVIDDSGVPGLGKGARFLVRSQASGSSVNGVETTLALEQHPVLVVNRQSGDVRIENFSSSSATVAFDAYDLRSTLGVMNPAGLNGLSAQGTGPGAWYTAAATPNGLGELSYPGETALAASTSISLGTIYAPTPASSFGEENEDLQFNFGIADGTIYGGLVLYEGMPDNTLVLNVDPSTGDAQIVNPTAWDVDIDAYVVSSASGSLNASGWASLDSTGADGNLWYEASTPDEFQLSELAFSQASVDASQSETIAIGAPFSIGAREDLVFQFALVGEEELRTGKVVYSALVTPVSLPGDYNGDQVVDGQDYAFWRENLGTSTVMDNDTTPGSVDAGDLTVWRNNYGATSLANSPAPAVPEPATAMLGLVVGLACCAGRRR